MIRLFLISIFLFPLITNAQQCNLRLISYEFEELKSDEHNILISQGFKYNLSVEIYSSCYLETYPIVSIKNKVTGEMISQSSLNSFGQMPNTFDKYILPVKSKDQVFDSVNFMMQSAMGKENQIISIDTVSKTNELRVVDVQENKKLEYLTIELEKELYNIVIKSFCKGEIFADINIFNHHHPHNKIIIPKPDNCDTNELFLWIEGFEGKSEKNKLIFRKSINTFKNN